MSKSLLFSPSLWMGTPRRVKEIGSAETLEGGSGMDPSLVDGSAHSIPS
jgi:hypothetical protein